MDSEGEDCQRHLWKKERLYETGRSDGEIQVECHCGGSNEDLHRVCNGLERMYIRAWSIVRVTP